MVVLAEGPASRTHASAPSAEMRTCGCGYHAGRGCCRGSRVPRLRSGPGLVNCVSACSGNVTRNGTRVPVDLRGLHPADPSGDRESATSWSGPSRPRRSGWKRTGSRPRLRGSPRRSVAMLIGGEQEEPGLARREALQRGVSHSGRWIHGGVYQKCTSFRSVVNAAEKCVFFRAISWRRFLISPAVDRAPSARRTSHQHGHLLRSRLP